MNLRSHHTFPTLALSMMIGWGSSIAMPAQERPNILFIGVDDMNCDFGACGNPVVHSPNLDTLASRGVLFANNHAQKAVCGPSRASLLSGFTPEHTGITSFRMYLRDMYPDVVTLPQFFKQQGYTTVGMGKIHDPRNVSETDQVDLISWTEFVDVPGNRYAESSGKPLVEAADVEDEGYLDGNLAAEGVSRIRQLAGGEDPFFLAVGFKKPHLPFAAPRKYWDLYDRDSIPLAPFRRFAENDQEFVHNPGAELRNNYDNVPAEGAFPFDLQREYIHGYYACVSYIDAQVGKLIEALKEEGLYEETIIVLWGDHGFSLGDHTNWGKHTNFEYATRCPLIIKAPGMASGITSHAPSELLDIYPTLVDLAGFPVPDTLDGNSLLPILDGSRDHVKSFAMSQFRRGGNQGFALRSDYYQYVEWMDGADVNHRQLFNFVADPFQTMNLRLASGFQEIIDTLSLRMHQYLETGENTSPILITSQTDSLGTYRKDVRVQFSVFGADGPLEEVGVTIGPLEIPTSQAGYTALNLPPGTYTYVLDKPLYESAGGTFILTGDTLIRDTLERQFYEVTFTLSDAYSGDPLAGASVEFDGVEGTTGLDGNVSFTQEKGDGTFMAASPGYFTLEETVEIQSDTAFAYALEPTHARVKFKLREGEVPVNGASVTLDGDVLTSNALGFATFENLPVKADYPYSVEKQGYKEISNSLYLLTDTTVSIKMERARYAITFEVTEDPSAWPLPEVLVTLGDSAKHTGDNGMALFSNYAPGEYTYTLQKQGYGPGGGTLTIKGDTLVEVAMISTGLGPMSGATALTLYPVPVHDILYLNNRHNLEHLEIWDVTGTKFAVNPEMGPRGRINVAALAPGVYLLKAWKDQGIPVVKRFMIKR